MREKVAISILSENLLLLNMHWSNGRQPETTLQSQPSATVYVHIWLWKLASLLPAQVHAQPVLLQLSTLACRISTQFLFRNSTTDKNSSIFILVRILSVHTLKCAKYVIMTRGDRLLVLLLDMLFFLFINVTVRQTTCSVLVTDLDLTTQKN